MRFDLYLNIFKNDIYNLNFIFSLFIVTPLGYARGKGHHESSVHRNPYEAHNAYDIIRTQDADLAVSKTTILYLKGEGVEEYTQFTYEVIFEPSLCLFLRGARHLVQVVSFVDFDITYGYFRSLV